MNNFPNQKGKSRIRTSDIYDKGRSSYLFKLILFPPLRFDFMLIEKLCSRATTYLNFSPFGPLVGEILDFKDLEKMFGNSYRATTPAPEVPMAEEVEQLRQDATRTAAEIIDGVQANFVSTNDFTQYYEQLESRLNNIYSAIEILIKD
ncbi:hypothetical protein BCR32DRAFT_288386 [Anaeromyces robustus]|uniref:Uncharacterized protein n=1 Tax=Anaeromyces robustus TaxID=1754192 RepID=A0A1Y1UY82_9FUNG|nr:hypothetical protein BCR32DRAFT_288386 [Anaeromyces robustus]|eukprot:ORX42715.1 hypothetical protein BCR32DRAFT_288386 [Anaeromyces robustus]